RPHLYFAWAPERSPWVSLNDMRTRGGILVWPAADNSGTAPETLKVQFPEMVPEVPRSFPRAVQGMLPLIRIGWSMQRPQKLVIAFAPAYLAEEQPIDKRDVAENDRQQQKRAKQHENLAGRRCRRIPNRERRRDQVREVGDYEPKKAEKEKRHGRQERRPLAPVFDPSPCEVGGKRRNQKDRPKKNKVR